MGLNTTVLVLNDALHDIKNDPDFGKNLASVIMSGKPQYVGNGTTVLETHHADWYSLMAIGGNRGIQLSSIYSREIGEELNKQVLHELAYKLGYRLVKKKSQLKT